MVEPQNYTKLTQQERRALRLSYIADQGGKCHFCGLAIDGPPGPKSDKRVYWGYFPATFKLHPVHLHHNHNTGMTIGAVHMKCNAILWQYYGE